MIMSEQTPLLDRQEKKKPSPWYIIVPLFCLTFSFSALYAPMVQFYTLIFCKKYYEDDNVSIDKCSIPQIQSTVSRAQAIIMFLTYISTLLFASYYGSLSDRKGRRLVLQISTFGNLLLVASYILTFHFQHIFGISLLFIVPAIRGIFAGDTVLIATAQAYISDCTTPSERTLAFSYMMSSLFIGATLGPSVGSLLLKQTNSILSIFYVTIVINLLFSLYVYIFLPESNNNHKQTMQKPKSMLQRINVFSTLSILIKTKPQHATRYALPMIAAIQFLLNIVALPPHLLYAMLKFNWTAYEGGFYISLVGFTRLLTTMVILPLITKIFRQPERLIEDDDDSLCKADDDTIKDETQDETNINYSIVFDCWLIRSGLMFETVCLVATGMVTTSFGFTAASLIHSLSFLATPSIRSLLTSLVEPSKVGELLGAMTVLEAIAMMVSQLSINTIYSASVSTMPELVFYICGLVSGIALCLSLFI